MNEVEKLKNEIEHLDNIATEQEKQIQELKDKLNNINLWWKCPNCKNKIEFNDKMSFVFDEDGEADFDPKRGLFFHIIDCECGAEWVVSISEMNINNYTKVIKHFCPECLESREFTSVFIEEDFNIKGETVTILSHYYKCKECEELILNPENNDENYISAYEKYRSHHKTVQNEDLLNILQKVMDEGFIDDELIEEFSKRAKEYNTFLDNKISEFRKDMEE